MTAYTSAEWSDLFVATAGASAALVGLLVVAASINLQEIVANAALPGRAAEAIVVLVGVLVASTFGLVPGQPAWGLGIEVAAAGLVAWGLVTWPLRRPIADDQAPRASRPARLVLTQAATLPFVVGGVTLVLGAGGGLYWVVAGIVAAFCVALIDAWVLLVEIRR